MYEFLSREKEEADSSSPTPSVAAIDTQIDLKRQIDDIANGMADIFSAVYTENTSKIIRNGPNSNAGYQDKRSYHPALNNA